jgi:hypothetical protein
MNAIKLVTLLCTVTQPTLRIEHLNAEARFSEVRKTHALSK